MKKIREIIVLAVAAFSFSAVKAQTEDTTVHYQHDSAIVDSDPTAFFFQQGEKTSTPGKILVITKTRKTLTLANLLKATDLNTGKWISGGSDINSSIDYVFSDLDNDGKEELVISNFTGGAHCCDEIYIYKNIAPNKYQYVVRMLGGHTVITALKEFEFSFNESFGYFFTCYACGYADTSDAAPIPLQSITLRYNKGKIAVVAGDQELRSTINDNLGKLGEQPFEQLDELAMDEGLRKEFAMNLAVYYYSFGRNLTATQQLFNKYYKYPDAKKVWAAFTKNLLSVKKDNDF